MNPQNTAPTGGANITGPQVAPASAITFAIAALSTSPASVAAASTARKELWLQNLDASILCYAAPASDVSATTGVLLSPRGAPVKLTGQLAQLQWYALSASGTPNLMLGTGV